MKKIFKSKIGIVIIIVFMLFLCSCEYKSKESEDLTFSDENCIEKSYSYNGLANDEKFLNAIKENPIDKAFAEIVYSGSNIQIIEENCKYKGYWENEINASYNHLLEISTADECAYLKLSQNSWSQYIFANNNLQESILNSDSNESESGGAYEAAVISIYQHKEVKNRAIELLEYLYIKTGNVEFVYDFEG